MTVARTLLLALFLVGGCGQEHASTAHHRARARTSGGSARVDGRASSATRDRTPDADTAEPAAERALPTAVDQSEAPSDVEITRSIRAAVWQDASLSFTARNVVIITQGSVVTLRGNVTHDERRSIHAHAFAAAGVTQIDDQLVVDP